MSIEAANFYSDHRVQASNTHAWFIQADADRQLVAVKVRTADYHWLIENGYDPEEFAGGHRPEETGYWDSGDDQCFTCKGESFLVRFVAAPGCTASSPENLKKYYPHYADKEIEHYHCSADCINGWRAVWVEHETPIVAEGAEDRLYIPFRTVAFPCKMVDCDTCRGNGRHVNPSIDAGGITDFDQWDYDEQDAYMSGAYDVACYAKCDNGKVPAVDVEAMCAEDLKVYTVWRAWQNEIEEEERAYAAERASEIRWGC